MTGGLYMAEKIDYESLEREGAGAGAFMLGLLTGTVLGAGLGVLMAPKKGVELRGELGERARTLSSAAATRYEQASKSAHELAEKGRDLAGQARKAVSRGAEEARSYAGTVNGSGH